ncbi:unnamed protein product [Microthlaspi erraticum]|uniref:Replication protein A 70 kDa DNA-binding subunit B/D first OB fold domain-containing protein n=1 Tax=Microthlaspi erraticum TaxID=1685480 RepID=A0A6D2JPE7_9BRAS|nr:unnamed protein product [Microthlaspi erraticum]
MTIGSAFTKLADVRSFKSSWKVRVKVLHSWSQFSGMSGETMELVLADEHKKDIGHLSNELQDGEWKVLENFTLSPATGQFRPISSKWKMSLFMNMVVLDVSEIRSVPVPEAEAFMHGFPDDGAIIFIKEDDQEKVEKFRIFCKVYGIDTDWGWYYFGCGKCQYRFTKDLKKEAPTKPRPNVPIWYCDRCKTNVKILSLKFKLLLLVEDETAKRSIWSTMEHLGHEDQGRTSCLELSLTAHAQSEEGSRL